MQLQAKYKKEIAPKLQAALGLKNVMAVPTLDKVVLNVGLGKALQDAKYLEVMADVFTRITGQKPVQTLAKKSIAAFKIRQGMTIGYKVTLRGKKMWEFIHKLVTVVLPRVRDFRGISADAFDGHGNYSLGMKEYLPFPEVRQDEVERMHGLEIVVATTAPDDAGAFQLLTMLGFPFKQKDKKDKKSQA
ncbi:50S ribosomal protein L5 [Candidatus Falkowbacteria bacterium]|nr:50S ribosomal protein L5 [Candidatus Falkowbacteria bacterium]